jgi:hypothetical protein
MTPESVRSAVEAAKEMAGFASGVLFFRWTSSGESLTMAPQEVLDAAAGAPAQRKRHSVEATDGECASVHCMDLYLDSADAYSSEPLRYSVRSSIEFEYFLPGENVPVRLTGPSEITLSVPPYCGRGRMYLGRAVTAEPGTFSVEQVQ